MALPINCTALLFISPTTLAVVIDEPLRNHAATTCLPTRCVRTCMPFQFNHFPTRTRKRVQFLLLSPGQTVPQARRRLLLNKYSRTDPFTSLSLACGTSSDSNDEDPQFIRQEVSALSPSLSSAPSWYICTKKRLCQVRNGSSEVASSRTYQRCFSSTSEPAL